MFRTLLGKLLWLGRATSAVVGLAVALALVVGVSSAALAGNLDPLKIGSLKNVATKTTALVGKVASGSALVVKNPSGGSALGLQVNAGQAPLSVNPEAGTAADLSADELDNKDSSELLGMEATLQPGQKLTGVFAASSSATSGLYNTAVGFRPKLPADIDDAHFHYLGPGQATTDCPGEGQAAPGHLCFYTAWINAATFNSGWPANSSGRTGNQSDQLGTALYFNSTGTGSNVRGTWAVTAPQATSQSLREAQEQPAGEAQSTPMGRVAR